MTARTAGTDGASLTVPDGAAAVTAPLPASVWQIDVRPGATVAKGDKLLSLEAMKMETIVTAPCDGTVAGIYADPGDQVDAGQVLMAIDPGAARAGTVSGGAAA